MPAVRPTPLIDLELQIHAAERLLFTEHKPATTIEILDPLLQDYDRWSLSDVTRYRLIGEARPYLLYLLGLAYEMNGEQAQAVQAYWTLWNDFPLHPLSYLVQQKLELVN